MNKLDYDYVKKFIENLGFKLISKEYLGNNKPIIVCDKQEYYYKTSYANLKSCRNPLKFTKYNPYTIQNIKLWCKINNKNFELISDTYQNNSSKLIWRCLKSNCKDLFLSSWTSIQQGQSCGVCHGKQVGKSNCLANKNPELAKEWHPTKNGELTPHDVTYGSDMRIWWQCLKDTSHIWKSTVSNRNEGYGCPYCARQLPSRDYNLLNNNPSLCEEWSFDKNIKQPSEYTPVSGKKVWWVCKKCSFEWQASISHRNNNRGCPKCNKSKGEKLIIRFLNFNNVAYIAQKTFKELLGVKNNKLSYDFYIPDCNLLIEYQGEFHDGTAKIQTKEAFEKQKEHDRRKRLYAKNNNIELLEIWYWDFDSIEDILNKKLKHIKRIRND